MKKVNELEAMLTKAPEKTLVKTPGKTLGSTTETERFVMAVNLEKFNYTEWRRTGLPEMRIEEIAAKADQLAAQLSNQQNT